MKHYFELNDAKDKAIHILYAGFVCGYYDESKKECSEEFGEEITKEAIKIFDTDYKQNCKEIV